MALPRFVRALGFRPINEGLGKCPKFLCAPVCRSPLSSRLPFQFRPRQIGLVRRRLHCKRAPSDRSASTSSRSSNFQFYAKRPSCRRRVRQESRKSTRPHPAVPFCRCLRSRPVQGLVQTSACWCLVFIPMQARLQVSRSLAVACHSTLLQVHRRSMRWRRRQTTFLHRSTALAEL